MIERTTDSRIVNPPVGDGPAPKRPGPWLTAWNVLFSSIIVVDAASALWTFWFGEPCVGACLRPADRGEAVGLVVWLALGLAVITLTLRAVFGRRVER